MGGKFVTWDTEFDTDKPSFKLKPEILTCPNIPKPLHGISPRTIMGQQWWDNKRRKVYASTNYRCVACGVHKSNARARKCLEAHEYFNINYETGICKIKSIEPLCHFCHNFVHNGRLGVSGDIKFIRDVLDHGFDIVRKNNLAVFFNAVNLGNIVGANTVGVKTYTPKCSVKWLDWVLIFNGKEYRSNFKNYEEWMEFYSLP